jgi:hypothetical protein
VYGILQGDATDHTVNLLSLSQEQIGKVGAILAGDPCDQDAFLHVLLLTGLASDASA